MEIGAAHAGYAAADAAQVKRNAAPEQPKDGPLGPDAPQAKERGEAVVFGGSLANSDASSSSRDAERQRKIERHDAQHQRSEEKREAADQRRAERQEVDIRA